MPAALGGLEGKYLSFTLCGEEYGLEILKVREVISLMEITQVPQAPSHIKGVINLRGKVIPVVDMRLRFGMPAAEATDETCIIVVDLGGALAGALVDAVAQVENIDASQIEPPPLGGAMGGDFILGMGKVNGRVKILLDIDKAFSSSGILRGGAEEMN